MATHFRTRQFSFSVLAVILAFSSLLLITSLTFAKPAGTIIVNPGESIQAAINSTNPGDTILINAGTQTESLGGGLPIARATTTIIVTNTNDSGPGSLRQAIANASLNDTVEFSLTYPAIITLTSGQLTIDKDLTINGPGATNLKVSGNNSSRVFGIFGNVSIADLTIQDGSASYAAGIYATNALTLTNVNVLSNTATSGGCGVYVTGPARLSGGLFQNNLCLSDIDSLGGGLLAGNILMLSDTQFISNSASIQGGALYVSGAATFFGGLFLNNHASRGGGVYANSTLELKGTKFLSNTADEGGGLYARGSAVSIVNSLFAHNTTNRDGAALFLYSIGGRVDLLYTTIADHALNPKQAIFAQSGSVGITDTIIANHAIGIERWSGATVYEDYNLFFGNTTNVSGTISGGTHNVFGDPNFANPVLGNYHIISPSAAIDVGINAGVTTDLDGIPRPVGAGFDIGAYEYINFTSHVYLPLIRR